ncbi:MAG: DnaB-like helicase N-terminal domain-containing protein, partial [Nanoarchaeota archaeon]
MSLQNLELERHSIAGLLQYSEIYSEVCQFVSEADYTSQLHSLIFSIIKKTLNNGEQPDKLLIANSIQNLNIRFKDDIDVFGYLEALGLVQLNRGGLKKVFEELHKLGNIRKLYDNNRQMADYLGKDAVNDGFPKIISTLDGIYSNIVNSFSLRNEPQDLFANAEEYIESVGNKTDSDEIIAPYKNFQDLFGGFFPSDLVIFASAAKAGKSTILLDIMIKCCAILNKDVRGLFIDSELELPRVQRRAVAAMADINEYYLKTPKWRQYPETAQKVRAVWPKIKEYFNKIDHIYVGHNHTSDQLVSLIKHWHWKHIKNTKTKPLICIDYFK